MLHFIWNSIQSRPENMSHAVRRTYHSAAVRRGAGAQRTCQSCVRQAANMLRACCECFDCLLTVFFFKLCHFSTTTKGWLEPPNRAGRPRPSCSRTEARIFVFRGKENGSEAVTSELGTGVRTTHAQPPVGGRS